MFKVSVIIPVFNAEKYLAKAIESALMQTEVEEIILIEDCSPDNCLQICLEYANKNHRIKFFQHADKKNHGPAETRNLGIVKASCEYISFLDADDFYIHERFKIDSVIFHKDSSIDGVYSAIAPVAYDEHGNSRLEIDKDFITTLAKYIHPDELFENMSPIGFQGCFSINGLTVKKKVFNKTGLLNTSLHLSEDTHFFIKLAALCKLVPGSLTKPVAFYGLHRENRSQFIEKFEALWPFMFYDLFLWARRQNISKKRIFLIWERFYQYKLKIDNLDRKEQRILLLKELLNFPWLIFSRFFIKQLPIISRILP